MRGTDRQQSTMFSYISAERRVPKDHPLRAVRAMVDAALSELGPRFDAIYAANGRPSIPPEKPGDRCRVDDRPALVRQHLSDRAFGCIPVRGEPDVGRGALKKPKAHRSIHDREGRLRVGDDDGACAANTCR